MSFSVCPRCEFGIADVAEHPGHKLRWFRKTVNHTPHLHVRCPRCGHGRVLALGPGESWPQALRNGLDAPTMSRAGRNRDSGRSDEHPST